MEDAPLESLGAGELPELGGPRNWRRVKAGLLVELGLADKGAARRAQDAVRSGSFDVDAAASELLATAAVDDGDPRLSERSARLARDLVMTPLQRGARGVARRTRQATRSGVAWLVTQVVVVGVVATMVFVALLVARYRWGLSVDEALDRTLSMLPGR